MRVEAEGGCVQVVAIDIAGAFYRVFHVGLLNKAERVGIGGPLLSWLRDYLSNRCLKVVTGGQASKKYPSTAGVPQGSVLGPTLFIIVCCRHRPMPLAWSKAQLFGPWHYRVQSDQTKRRPPAEGSILTGNPQQSCRWGQQWRIQFEPTKSQRLILCNARKRPDFPPTTFAGEIIPDSDYLKLLGVTFDSKLGFQRHIHAVAVKARQRLGFLHRAAWLLGHEGRLAVYKGFIRPILEYAPLATMSAALSHLARYDRVQEKAMRNIGPGTILLNLQLRRAVSGLAYVYKLHYIKGPPQLTALLPPQSAPAPTPRTRRQLTSGHPFQFQWPLARTAPNYLSFPYTLIAAWNDIPEQAISWITMSFPNNQKRTQYKLSNTAAMRYVFSLHCGEFPLGTDTRIILIQSYTNRRSPR